jgi:hypothetical protein
MVAGASADAPLQEAVTRWIVDSLSGVDLLCCLAEAPPYSASTGAAFFAGPASGRSSISVRNTAASASNAAAASNT